MATLKEEIKRLKEERVTLQRKLEEGAQANSDLQEQVIQLTKHVKLIPELRRDLNNLQNQRNNMERKMKQQSEQARGVYRILCKKKQLLCVKKKKLFVDEP